MPESTRSSRTDAQLWAVILAGGVGSRFWPVSTPARPKQLLPLASDRPLIVDTIDRIRPLVPFERVRVLAGSALAARMLESIAELEPANFLAEPRARGTAPVLAWAAFEIARLDPDAVMASLHADHRIEPASAFRDLLAEAGRLAAEHDLLFTIGVVPERPETGYGYVRPGRALGPGAFEVAEFVEKPDRETAEAYIAQGYLWNSGIFVWRAAALLREIEAHTPEIARLLPLLEQGDVEAFFERAPNLSVDLGVLERSRRVGVVRATFQWDDVGAWDALSRTRARDEAGNVAVGDAHFVDSQGCIAWAEDGTIVAYGVSDLVAVRAHGVTLILPRDRTADLKRLLEALPERLRQLEG